jgi:TetR/AcrR family transcriptional repressor of nem operon
VTTHQTELTRGRLLEAAFCEIHRHGFQAASIANILHDTGLTKGALYHHFPTKRDLGLAVVEEVVAGLLDELVFRRLRASDQPVATLIEIIGQRGGIGTEAVVLGCPLNNLMQEMSPLDAAFKEKLNAILNTWTRTVEDALRRGQEAGVLRPDVDCRAAALFITSAWEGCVGVAKNLQSPAKLRRCMQQLQGYVRSLMATA